MIQSFEDTAVVLLVMTSTTNLIMTLMATKLVRMALRRISAPVYYPAGREEPVYRGERYDTNSLEDMMH
jgi:hypothetical protein